MIFSRPRGGGGGAKSKLRYGPIRERREKRFEGSADNLVPSSSVLRDEWRRGRVSPAEVRREGDSKAVGEDLERGRSMYNGQIFDYDDDDYEADFKDDLGQESDDEDNENHLPNQNARNPDASGPHFDDKRTPV